MAQPLMPHATAAWLVDNSALTFEQIAHFCGLHILEIQAIADETSGTKLMATLLGVLKAKGGKYGLQTMCEGGGVANVTIVERL